MSQYSTCWITTNRSCNLRCKWCYAAGTGFKNDDFLNLNDAKKILNFCKDLNIKQIILIGGEPTVYPFIFDLIDYCKSLGFRVTIVTNGIIFANKEILNKYLEHKIDGFGVSMKGNNKEEYFQTTGQDLFDVFLTAVSNLKESGANFSVSQVLTYDNMSTYAKGIEVLKKAGAYSFTASFCYDFNCVEIEKSKRDIKNNPYVLSYLFSKYYEDIKTSISNSKFVLSQGLPLCVWDETIINKMVSEKSINSICQLLSGHGILFDTDLSLIPCNAMYALKYGKFGKDFNDLESFTAFMQSEKVSSMFKRLRGIPDYKCLECQKASQCGGGCVTNWTNYSFGELESSIKEEYLEWRKNNV